MAGIVACSPLLRRPVLPQAGDQAALEDEDGAIVKIRLPEARTRELDGNMRSWGRSGERARAAQHKLAGRELEREAG